MKVLVSRISSGSVLVGGELISAIDRGIAVLVGIEVNDKSSTIDIMASKVVNLRIFEDKNGKINLSVKDKGYEILCIPNFTLCASTEKGRRPSFDLSMPHNSAELFFKAFSECLKAKMVKVKLGSFGACMDIKLNMDGPFNLVLSSG